jgi:hypothetical protein
MKRLYPLTTVSSTPEGRRTVLLAVKKAARGRCTVWLDAAGLHVQGTKEVFEAAAKVLPAGGVAED